MKSIIFIDTEIEPTSGKILDIGSVKVDGSSFLSGSVAEFIKFLQGSQYICGHNILNHDLKYIQNAVNEAGLEGMDPIDTLHLSPLLFPTKPYHALLKDDKLQRVDYLHIGDFIKSLQENLDHQEWDKKANCRIFKESYCSSLLAR